jgi:acyl transferase domain-containing protein
MEQNHAHKPDQASTDPYEPIAVIGLDLKFPGDATTPEAFFDMLLEGRSARSEVPKERFNIDAFYHPDQERAGAVSLPGLSVFTRS